MKACNFIKKRLTQHRYFTAKFFRTVYFSRTSLVGASQINGKWVFLHPRGDQLLIWGYELRNKKIEKLCNQYFPIINLITVCCVFRSMVIVFSDHCRTIYPFVINFSLFFYRYLWPCYVLRPSRSATPISRNNPCVFLVSSGNID